MARRGNLRFDEQQYAEHAAKRARWSNDQRAMPDAGAATSTKAAQSPDAGSAHPSKYRAKPTNGYASAKEARRADELKALERAGQIRNLREQVPYLLIPAAKDAEGKCIERACSIVIDFVYDEAPAWNPVAEDTKGFRTEAYRIKRKLLYMVHGIRVRET